MDQENLKSGPPLVPGKPRKYMVFSIATERYAVPLSHVKEVIGLSNMTTVPNMPAYFRGLVNLRGKIVSAIDLKIRLRVQSNVKSVRPCVIITEVQGTYFGAIVDDVTEVVTLSEENFDRGVEGTLSGADGVVGAAKIPDRPLTLVLDLQTVLNVHELLAMVAQNKSAA